MIVDHIEKRHAEENLSYREVCAEEEVGYTTFLRWRCRKAAGEDLVHPSGPHKVESLDLGRLADQVRVMPHGRKRSTGTGRIYEEHSESLSRRDLNRLVREARERKKRERERFGQRITWQASRLVWAMDDTEYRPDKRYPKAHLHNVEDLGSRYAFKPLVTLPLAKGVEVRDHLECLFKIHGAPLFVKRDNHGNLNHAEVDELLAKWLVIPVNSPVYYPQYNGGIERTQGQIKACLHADPLLPMAFLAIQAELDVEQLNHTRKGCLGNRTPCEIFTAGREQARLYNRFKRREVYDEIKEKMLALVEAKRYEGCRAWRMAVENWLQVNQFIKVTKHE